MSTQGIPFSRTALPGAQPADAPGSVRINAIWELPRLLEELGVDLQGALDAVGLEPAIFSDRENRVDYPVFGELLLECERRTGRDDFGLLIGQRTRLADFGLAGQVARCSDSAGAGLDNFISLFNLHNTAALVTEIATGDFARLVFAICEPRMSDTRHLQQGSMAIGFNILKDLCGPDWRPTEVNFACRSPASLRSFQKFFQAPLRFDSDESSVVFERSWLDAPLPPVDPAERLAIERAARVARAAVLADFPAFVRRLMRKQLLLGRYSMDEIAALLSIHRRTLHRRLAEHDAAYGDMLESVKYEVARQLLVDTDMPVQAIAESLRFSNAANFATAFKNWSGVTPTEFRSGSRG